MEKAPDAFRTISEVADEIDVPQHVLRFWESRFSADPADEARRRPPLLPSRRYRSAARRASPALRRGLHHPRRAAHFAREGPGFVQNVWRAGAEPPPPQLDEDEEDEAIEAEAADTRREPVRSAFNPAATREPSGQRPPEAAPAVAQPASIGIGAEERRKLQAALDDLLECRRLIEAALTA